MRTRESLGTHYPDKDLSAATQRADDAALAAETQAIRLESLNNTAAADADRAESARDSAIAAAGSGSTNLAYDARNRIALKLNRSNASFGRTRYGGLSVAMVTGDSDNPYPTPAEQIISGFAYRYLWLDEMGLKPGDTVTVGAEVYSSVAGTVVRVYSRNGAGTALATNYDSGAVAIGVGLYAGTFTIPATTAYLEIRVDLNGKTGKLLALGYVAVKGTAVTGIIDDGTPRSELIDLREGVQAYSGPPVNLAWDARNETLFRLGRTNATIGGLVRFTSGTPGSVSMIESDTESPYFTPIESLVIANAWSARHFHLSEMGLKPGDTVTAGAEIYAAESGHTLAVYSYNAAGSVISTHYGPTVIATGRNLITVSFVIPAGTTDIRIRTVKASGTTGKLLMLGYVVTLGSKAGYVIPDRPSRGEVLDVSDRVATIESTYDPTLSATYKQLQISRSISGTLAQVGPAASMSGGSGVDPNWRAWGTNFKPTANLTFNVIEVAPHSQVVLSVGKEIEVQVRNAMQTTILARGKVNAGDWNKNVGGTVKIMLDNAVTMAAGSTYVIVQHGFGLSMGYVGMAATALSDTRYWLDSGTTYAEPTPWITGIPVLNTSGASSAPPFFNLLYDPNAVVIDKAVADLTSFTGSLDIVVPRKFRTLIGGTGANIEQFNIYFRNIVHGDLNLVNLDCVATKGRQYADFWRIEPGNSAISHYPTTATTFDLTLKLLGKDGSLLKSKVTNVAVLAKSAGTSAVRYLAIGDSMTNGGVYQGRVRESLAGVTLQGIRTRDGGVVCHEGRGGWYAVQTSDGGGGYLNAGKTTGLDSPFMFPVGVAGTNYKGNVKTWERIINDPTGYDWAGFQKIARGWGADTDPYLYSATTGYPLNPQTGWVVFDPAQAVGSRFMEWNGSAWVAMASQPSGWEFSFAKYLERFAPAFTAGNPTHVSILLGANDFQTTDGIGSAITGYMSAIQTMIDSIHAVSSAIKVIVGLPIIGAHQDAWAQSQGCGGTAWNYDRNMKEVSRKILDTYDTAEMEAANVFVAPLIANIDPVYSFAKGTAEAAHKYATDTVARYNNWVHPLDAGYKQMGDVLAAVIEATR